VWEVKRTEFDSRDVALAAVFAALYAVLVIGQGLSAAATVQLRFADSLIPLSALFGLPVMVGVSLGCFVSNAFTSLTMANGVYDVVLGPIANLIAATVIYVLRNRRLIGCVVGSVVIGLIVGSYVWMIFGAPSSIFSFELPSSWPVWVASVASITISSLVAITIVGYILLTILSRPSIVGSLKSRGLKVTTNSKKTT